ncbi:MAG: GNAT family N-acetyltransferase [Bacteroidota bacterium]
MQNNYLTNRLLLTELNPDDQEIILELLNTPEWIKFIGDRNVKTKEDAREYIQKIIDNPKANYWVVRLRHLQVPIGIITFIKRDYLEHYDIGFAFFSKYAKADMPMRPQQLY